MYKSKASAALSCLAPKERTQEEFRLQVASKKRLCDLLTGGGSNHNHRRVQPCLPVDVGEASSRDTSCGNIGNSLVTMKADGVRKWIYGIRLKLRDTTVSQEALLWVWEVDPRKTPMVFKNLTDTHISRQLAQFDAVTEILLDAEECRVSCVNDEPKTKNTPEQLGVYLVFDLLFFVPSSGVLGGVIKEWMSSIWDYIHPDSSNQTTTKRKREEMNSNNTQYGVMQLPLVGRLLLLVHLFGEGVMACELHKALYYSMRSVSGEHGDKQPISTNSCPCTQNTTKCSFPVFSCANTTPLGVFRTIKPDTKNMGSLASLAGACFVKPYLYTSSSWQPQDIAFRLQSLSTGRSGRSARVGPGAHSENVDACEELTAFWMSSHHSPECVFSFSVYDLAETDKHDISCLEEIIQTTCQTDGYILNHPLAPCLSGSQTPLYVSNKSVLLQKLIQSSQKTKPGISTLYTIKCKPHATVDVQVDQTVCEGGSLVYTCLLSRGRNDPLVSIGSIDDTKWGILGKLEQMPTLVPGQNRPCCIVECVVGTALPEQGTLALVASDCFCRSTKQIRLKPVKWRHDKVRPNSVHTFKGVLATSVMIQTRGLLGSLRLCL